MGETRMTNVENRLESMETKLNTLLHNSVSQTKPDRPQFDMSIKNKKYTTKNKANEEQGKEYTTRKHLDTKEIKEENSKEDRQLLRGREDPRKRKRRKKRKKRKNSEGD